jgi:predicted ester cyclase
MSKEENMALIKEYYANVLNGNKLDLIDIYFSENYVSHSWFKNRDGLGKALLDHRKVYPKIRFDLQDMISEGDRIAVRSKITLIDNKNIKKVISEIEIHRIEHGQFVEGWIHSDSFF